MRRLCVFLASAALVFSQESKSDPKKDPDQIGTRDVSKGINFYSLEKEIALGRQMAQEVEKKARVVNDPLISEYVNRIGQNISRHSDTRIPITVKVIEGDDANAVTLPGGFIFVQTELLRTAATEAELAAALSHEIGHIAARHGTRQASQAQMTQLATIPLIFLGGWGGICARGAASVLTPVGLLGYQRSFESEADMLGLQYLYKSGYDPEALVDIFEKILSGDLKKHPQLAKLLSTHPETGDRISKVQKNIEAMLRDQPQYIVTTSGFAEVKARLYELDHTHKPEPVEPKAPTLRKPGDKIARGKSGVPENPLQASLAREVYNK